MDSLALDANCSFVLNRADPIVAMRLQERASAPGTLFP